MPQAKPINARPLAERIWVNLPQYSGEERVDLMNDAALAMWEDYKGVQTKGEGISDAYVLDYVSLPARNFESSGAWVAEDSDLNVWSLVCNNRTKTNLHDDVQKNVPITVLGVALMGDIANPADLQAILENGSLEFKAPNEDFRQPPVPLHKAIIQPKTMNGLRVQTDSTADTATDSGKEFYAFNEGGILWLDRPMFIPKESSGLMTIKGMGGVALASDDLKLQLRLLVLKGIRG